MEKIEEFRDKYSLYNESKIFLEKIKNGETPIEYIPSGLNLIKLSQNGKSVQNIINQYLSDIIQKIIDIHKENIENKKLYIAINERDYNKILCTCYAYVLMCTNNLLTEEQRKCTCLVEPLKYRDVEFIHGNTLSIEPISVETYNIIQNISYWTKIDHLIVPKCYFPILYSIINTKSYTEYIKLTKAYELQETTSAIKELVYYNKVEEDYYLQNLPQKIIQRRLDAAYLFETNIIKSVINDIAMKMVDEEDPYQNQERIDKISILNQELIKRENKTNLKH